MLTIKRIYRSSLHSLQTGMFYGYIFG